MKIVQSFWSCNKNNLLDFAAGWCAPEYNMIGWALSCLQLRKYYDDVVLYADDTTAKLLIDTLCLPYTEVNCGLNELNRYDSKLWALPKVYAYSKQTSPFLHVDGDVFIFKPFSDDLLNSALIAQNLEFSTVFYEKHMKKLEMLASYIPVEISEIRSEEKEIRSYNAGILGGNDLAFFKEYTEKAFACIKKNEDRYTEMDLGVFNVFFEQCLFYALVQKGNRDVGVEIPGIVGDTDYVDLGDFHEVPFNRKYLHLLGNFKRNKSICDQMAYRLRMDHPEFYYRIIALTKNNRLPLEKDYYHFLNIHTEDQLLKRYYDLNTEAASLLCDAPVSNGRLVSNDFPTMLGKEIGTTIKNRYTHLSLQSMNLIQKDLELFAEKLEDILLYKFNKYNNDDLYRRDIRQAKQGQLIFNDQCNGFKRRIVKAPCLEIVECSYNWHEAYQCCLSNEKITFPLNTKPDTIYVGVIPECTASSCSLVSIDEFDYLIIEILEIPRSVNQLFAEIKTYMEPEVIERSLPELENLLYSRIKIALKNKIIEGIDHDK